MPRNIPIDGLASRTRSLCFFRHRSQATYISFCHPRPKTSPAIVVDRLEVPGKCHGDERGGAGFSPDEAEARAGAGGDRPEFVVHRCVTPRY